jgi:hypothetical protein
MWMMGVFVMVLFGYVTAGTLEPGGEIVEKETELQVRRGDGANENAPLTIRVHLRCICEAAAALVLLLI